MRRHSVFTLILIFTVLHQTTGSSSVCGQVKNVWDNLCSKDVESTTGIKIAQGRPGKRGQQGQKGERGKPGPPGPAGNVDYDQISKTFEMKLQSVTEEHKEETRELRERIKRLESVLGVSGPITIIKECEQRNYYFNSGDQITDYVLVKTAVPTMKYITVCAWLTPAKGTTVRGSLLSYANSESPNAFLIYFLDGDSLQMFLNNDLLVETPTIKIKSRTHFCVAASPISKTADVYLNGKLVHKLKYGGKQKAIPGGGSMIIGQEQDSIGGKFDAAQSFSGSIESFMTWYNLLNSDDILALYKSKCPCSKSYYDSMKGEFLSKGNVKPVTTECKA